MADHIPYLDIGYHVRFLEDIQSLPSIRKFVEQSTGETGLTEAYNSALLALKAFRDEHIKIVTLYVLSPSKHVAQAQATTPKAKEENSQKGTGGSGDLFIFLKGMRDDTKNSTL